MTVQRNAAFDRLMAELQRLGPDAQQSPGEAADYQSFVQRFSAAALPELTLDAYCVGKNGASFCWWLERGLEPLLGRYNACFRKKWRHLLQCLFGIRQINFLIVRCCLI